MDSEQVYIASGAGFSGDRFDASLPLVEMMQDIAAPKYLIFEVLAERTIAVAHKLRQKHPEAGYSPYLEHYLRPVLAQAKEAGITIISNMGAANPEGAARQIIRLAAELDMPVPSIAVVTGDDVRAFLDDRLLATAEIIEGNELYAENIVSANAYLGVRPIAEALSHSPDIVIVGRTTDSALVLGPLIHEFGWSEDAYDRLASGTICGHLLECGGQVTGAYFADPGFKDVPDLAHVGFPFACVSQDGSFYISKAEGTGGCVTKATVTEQLLYEMHDPSAYYVPDVIADISEISLTETGTDRITVSDVKGHPPTDTLKVTICMQAGWLAEAEMSYAGANGLARAELAAEIVKTRLSSDGLDTALRCDVLGAYGPLDGGKPRTDINALAFDGDYRLRLALMADREEQAQRVYDELQSLYCSGPAGGGGFRGAVTEQISTASVLIDRQAVEAQVTTSLFKSEG